MTLRPTARLLPLRSVVLSRLVALEDGMGLVYPPGALNGALRAISDCHFRKTATEPARNSGIKWLSLL
jgi:hypothetical protein